MICFGYTLGVIGSGYDVDEKAFNKGHFHTKQRYAKNVITLLNIATKRAVSCKACSSMASVQPTC